MFASGVNLFNSILCPALRESRDCTLLNCIFHHDLSKKRSTETGSSPKPEEVKRQKTEMKVHTTTKDGGVVSFDASKKVAPETPETPETTSRKRVEPIPATSTKLSKQEDSGPLTQAKPSKPSPSSAATLTAIGPNKSLDRLASQPSSSRPKDEKLPSSDIKLLPKPVLPYSPATLQQRQNYLHAIQKALVEIKMGLPNYHAVEAEYKVAKASSKAIYPNNIRHLVMDIKRGTYKKQQQNQKRDGVAKNILTAAPAEVVEKLQKLIIEPTVLNKWGYILDVPKETLFSIKSEKTCDRCQSTFHIGDKSICRYHPRRATPVPSSLFKEKRHDCCQGAKGSPGCETKDYHVFKVDDPGLLQSIIPFAHTPSATTPKTLKVIGLDCEMSYTTFGTEMVRLTAVDYFSKRVVLDRTVHPFGQIIDYNTLFSGISDLKSGLKLPDGTILPTISFKEARRLFFELVSDSTIIIGHGLDNDLNAMRIIHKSVIDTALRYPDYDPPYRKSLKQLTWTYLSRTIQTGQHDSSEDAIAAMDIVRYQVCRKEQ
ncbi:hypothetical protein TRVA0_043S00364 [Trichomonascus vanleenenianus]|uniref:RNA exonuclease n=1 Tax=Trichomonascus vanleenenianus TaxID=2268995 RepID=UPI003ECB9A7E